jgi:hypothetical protein
MEQKKTKFGCFWSLCRVLTKSGHLGSLFAECRGFAECHGRATAMALGKEYLKKINFFAECPDSWYSAKNF